MKLELDQEMIDQLFKDLLEIPGKYCYSILKYLSATIDEQNKPQNEEEIKEDK